MCCFKKKQCRGIQGLYCKQKQNVVMTKSMLWWAWGCVDEGRAARLSRLEGVLGDKITGNPVYHLGLAASVSK